MAEAAASPSQRFIVELPKELARDLDVFCEYHFDASRAAVVRRAIKVLIEREMEKDAALKRRIEAKRLRYLEQSKKKTSTP